MPNKKISELAEKFSLSGVDLIPIVDQSTGITKKITGNTLVRFTNTDLRTLSSTWDSTYSTIASTSADWEFAYQEVSLKSPIWNSAPSLYLALSGGRVGGNTRFDQNVTVYGNLTALGTTTFANSYVSTTSALSVVNVGNGEALNVFNTGPGAVARFIDAATFTEVFHIGGVEGFEPNVGVFTSKPGKHFTVAGEISATRDISTGGSFVGDGSKLISISANNITSGILSNAIMPASATFTNSVSSRTYYGDGSNLTGVVKSQFFLSAASVEGLGGVKVDNTSIQIDANGLISYTLPANATFTSSVSAPTLRGMFYGDGSNLTNLPLYFLSAASTQDIGGVKVDGTTITINENGVIRSNTPANATFTSSVSAPALSGVHFGDGSNLTGVVKTQYAPPANATFTSSVSAPALSGVHFGDGSNLTGVVKTQYTLPIASSSIIGGVRVDGTTINISSNGTIRVVGGTGSSGAAALSASTTVVGGIRVDGSSSSVDSNGYLKLISSDIGINDNLNKSRLWERVDTFHTENLPWAHIAGSSDGRYLVGVAQDGYLYVFIDGSLAYTSTVGAKNWGKVAVSFNGQYIVATENNGLVWESSDYGLTFQSKISIKSWTGIAISSNGQYQTAIATGEQISKSSDYGENWASLGESKGWTGVAMSFDGRYQTACAFGESVYVSRNYGTSFDSVVGTETKSWTDVAMSFDGKIQFAVETTNFYRSTDYGATFVSISVPEIFKQIECSSSGEEVLALAANGVIYISNNRGTTWRQKIVNNGTSGSIVVAGNGTKQFVSINGVIYKGNTTNYYFDKALSATSFFGDGRNLTNLNIDVPIATSLAVGGVRLDGLIFSADNTGLLSFAFPANATIVSSLSAPALRGMFYGDGSQITNLNATNISSGTLNNNRLPAIATFTTSISSAAVNGMFYGNGSQITNLNATNVSSGTLDNNRLPAIATFSSSVSSAALSGSFYGEGSLLTNLNASALTSGTLDNSRLPSNISVTTGTFATSVSSAALSGSFYGEGSLLTNLNASAVSSGTLNNARLPSNISVTTGTFAASVSAPAIRGMLYGDGSNITGVAASGGFATDLTKLPLSGGLIQGNLTVTGDFSAAGLVSFIGNTVFTSSSSLSVINNSPNDIPALYIGQSGPGDIASFYDLDQGVEVLHIGGHNGSYPNIGIKTSVPNKTLTVVGEISATGDVHSSGRFFGDGSSLSGVRFVSDLTVSLPDGKTFGRYASGDVIPAQGKTAVEVVQMAVVAPINPTVGLTSSTAIGFNQTAISNVLNFSHTINSLGGSVATASLEWRRNNTGSWTVLSTGTDSSGTYTHTLTDTNNNAQPFNYRYVVTDNKGATSTATINLTPTAYSAPTITLVVDAVSITSPETNLIREKGNVSSRISGTITRNSSNVSLTNYTIQCRINGDTWVDINSAVSISGNSPAINLVTHNATGSESANMIEYRIKVVDANGTVYSSVVTVNFLHLVFYGTSSSAPLNSASVRALSNRIFVTDSNPFVLNTGTTNSKFTVAVPSTLSVTEVLDLDAASLNITNNYNSSTFNVNDTSNTPISYKVYTLSNSVPYGSNHRHQITRA